MGKRVSYPISGCVIHSDQGSVYTLYAYQKAIKEKGITNKHVP